MYRGVPAECITRVTCNIIYPWERPSNHLMSYKDGKKKESSALIAIKEESQEQSISGCMFWLWKLIFLKASVVFTSASWQLPCAATPRTRRTCWSLCVLNHWLRPEGIQLPSKGFFSCDAPVCGVSWWPDPRVIHSLFCQCRLIVSLETVSEKKHPQSCRLHKHIKAHCVCKYICTNHDFIFITSNKQHVSLL